MELGIEGRAALVTGASRGIGRAIATCLAAEGARVLAVGRDADALADVAAATGAAIAVADITDPDAAQTLVERCRSELGALDILVNNAGTTRSRPLEQLTDADWEEQWQLSVMAPLRLMRAAAPLMAERGWGRIVNVSSSSGKRPSLRNAAYSVGKAAQLSLSRAYADAYAASGVLVNAVTPGVVASGLWTGPGGLAEQAAQASGRSAEEELARAAAAIPRGRLGAEDEIAAVVCFLCSELAANVAGAAWSVDGGAVPVII
jgi:3-oxoacyl-[acyl-carrier protein] reductase